MLRSRHSTDSGLSVIAAKNIRKNSYVMCTAAIVEMEVWWTISRHSNYNTKLDYILGLCILFLLLRIVFDKRLYVIFSCIYVLTYHSKENKQVMLKRCS